MLDPYLRLARNIFPPEPQVPPTWRATPSLFMGEEAQCQSTEAVRTHFAPGGGQVHRTPLRAFGEVRYIQRSCDTDSRVSICTAWTTWPACVRCGDTGVQNRAEGDEATPQSTRLVSLVVCDVLEIYVGE